LGLLLRLRLGLLLGLLLRLRLGLFPRFLRRRRRRESEAAGEAERDAKVAGGCP
jgi:hypothetical protein